MHERDAAATGAGARGVVDEAVPSRSARRERGVEIGHAIAEVMNPGAAAGQELCDRSVRFLRCQQFDVDVAEREGNNRRAVSRFGGRGRDPEDVPVERERFVQIADGDADVRYGWVWQVHRTPIVMNESCRPQWRGDEHNGRPDDMAETTHPLHVSDDAFSEEIEKYEGLVMVDFWATWCGPCQIIAPVVEQLAIEYAERGLKVAKLDVDANQRTTMRFNVRSIPSVLFFKNGEHVDTVVGAVPKKYLVEKIEEHLD